MTGHVGVTFVEKICPLGVCQVHLHPCSSGHGEKSLSMKGTGTGLGAKTKALETEMCLFGVFRYVSQGNEQTVLLGFLLNHDHGGNHC